MTLNIGKFIAKETILKCSKCQKIYKSHELQNLIMPWCDFGYDVFVHVGKSIFLDYRNEKEIQSELGKRNIKISTSEISYLGKKFIICLAIAHRENSPDIKEAIERKGGHILHVDAMSDGDSPHLMSGIDEISNIVLGNVKLPSEKGEKIIPFFEKLKRTFGNPLAIVRDMGAGISSAIKSVFKGVLDYICHFHFLRDIGKDLFGKENEIIRNRFKHYGIQGNLRKQCLSLKKKIDKQPELVQMLDKNLEHGIIEEWALEYTPTITVYTMIQWALDGKNQGQGYGFPFDRPYLIFFQRLQEVYIQCQQLQDKWLRGKIKDNRPFYKTYVLLKDIVNDKKCIAAIELMKEKIVVFDKLRDAMRITDPDEKKGLNDDGKSGDIKKIEQGVKGFREWLVNDKCFKENKDYKKMVAQIDKYWEKLFADPIYVNTPQGIIKIQPQRTNNLLERFFRGIRYGYRKKSGNNKMGKTLKAMLVDTPLVKNLQNPEYLKIILNGKTTLEERFAEIDTQLVREEMKKTQEGLEKIPSEIKKMIKNPELPQMLADFFENQLIIQKSN